MSLPEKLKSKNCRLTLIFFVYIISIFIFAIIYQGAYEKDSESFVFAENIYATKVNNQNQIDSLDVISLTNEKNYLDSILVKINSEKRIDSSYNLTSYQTYRYKLNNKFLDIEINEMFPKVNKAHILSIRNHKKIINQSFHTLKIEYPYDSINISLNIINLRLKEIDHEIRLKTKVDNIAKWELFDFIYFSTITQATVGYGDMLPNSTFIRNIVTLQTILGVFLSIILIAYSLKNKNN